LGIAVIAVIGGIGIAVVAVTVVMDQLLGGIGDNWKEGRLTLKNPSYQRFYIALLPVSVQINYFSSTVQP